MLLWILIGFLVYLAVVILTLALCKAAARGDRRYREALFRDMERH